MLVTSDVTQLHVPKLQVSALPQVLDLPKAAVSSCPAPF